MRTAWSATTRSAGWAPRGASPATYGGGRYLTDIVKGTFGRGLTLLGDDRVRLDVDCVDNPSCAHESRWACPLAPAKNRLEAPIEAGEQVYPSAA